MKYAIMLGSNMFIGTNGVFTVEINGKLKEFFKVREIFRERSEGSYLAVDCDIKDFENKREVKLFKSKPVVADENIQIESDKKNLIAKRSDGSLIIKIEQIESDNPTLPKSGPIPELLKTNQVDAILRITGNFYAGDFKVNIDNENMNIGGVTLGGNLSVGTGGMRITQMGFSM
ncbi:hypothetical protein [Aequorivita antarctica]|uniref:Uncharacterized protein n=1 Tax=Aequorivita antarctica TaxID=153266 RepID=A0A5C6YWA3_9FLAO|nr:hypothetical protein [Aequorivita antarctica]TXD71671.1 hypothetical protein ESU54_15490 [Aequorivita antarctica]SRX75775.1 hypothetical protein AEQU3_02771 [Aequorivita antarctica]